MHITYHNSNHRNIFAFMKVVALIMIMVYMVIALLPNPIVIMGMVCAPDLFFIMVMLTVGMSARTIIHHTQKGN